MKTIEIYDPAMCCATGVCGPSVDTELLRVATVVDTLKKQGVDIKRFNLASEPQAFISNKIINDLLMQDNDILPVTLVDGAVAKTKKHLSNDEFSTLTGILSVNAPQPAAACCSGTPDDTTEACCSGAEESAGSACCCCADADEEKEETAPCCTPDSGCC